jgi:hypothetical protein
MTSKFVSLAVVLALLSGNELRGKFPTTAAARGEQQFVPTVDIPAPRTGVNGDLQLGGQAVRIEVDDTRLNTQLSVWYRLAYIEGGSRLRVFEHYPATVHDPAQSIVESQTIAWHFANVVLGLDNAVAPGAPPPWARFHTNNDTGGSGGLIFTLAYLDLLSPAALVGDLRIAGTGGIGDNGVVTPASNVEIKLAAAALTHPDVVFSPRPSKWVDDVTIVESEHTRTPDPGYSIGEWLNLDGFEQAGRDAAGNAGTVAYVVVHDLRQVLAWLCGRTATELTCALARQSAVIPLASP